MSDLWTCAECGAPIVNASHGIVCANDDSWLVWEVVHKNRVCDHKRDGAWIDLKHLVGPRASRWLRAATGRGGILSSMNTAEVDGFWRNFCRPSYDQRRVRTTPLREFLMTCVRDEDAPDALQAHAVACVRALGAGARPYVDDLWQAVQVMPGDWRYGYVAELYRVWMAHGHWYAATETITPQTFYAWLMGQRERDDPVGDLARDVRQDRSFPRTPKPFRLLHNYIDDRGFAGATEAFDEAWNEWLAYGGEPIADKKPSAWKQAGWLALRFRVLKRDAYRCQICGRSAAEDGVKLEVDHRIPRAKGGRDEMSNLWVLCFDCNRGKSAHDL